MTKEPHKAAIGQLCYAVDSQSQISRLKGGQRDDYLIHELKTLSEWSLSEIKDNAYFRLKASFEQAIREIKRLQKENADLRKKLEASGD